MPKSWMPEDNALDGMLQENDAFFAQSDYPALLPKLTSMALLYDIPFQYLIPSEMYLEPDTLRFFHMDTHWLFALLDGALSLGRTHALDLQLDAKVIEEVLADALANTNRVRPALQGLALPEALENAPFICTGFLLRSPLVRGWRGLEFKAYNGQETLTALRIETLKDDVLLGLYAGEITTLEILEPPEGLHYGFSRSKNQLTKKLRRLEDGELYSDKEVTLCERGNRVLDFAKCAKDIQNTLGLSDEVSSAHIALQMIQNAYKISVSKEG